MPFRVESASSDARFFADGLGDTIQSALSSKRIRVVSRTDAGALAGPDAEAAIARLGVRLILDGSAATDGKTLDVSVHVDDAVDHLTLWSGHFTGDTDHRDELKTSVAATTVAVLNCSSDAVAPHGLTDRQVLMLYLRACDLYERQADPQAREQLFDALRQVTLRAPRFAPGLAMRAEALAGLAGYYSPDEAAALVADARVEADRALAIDPTNARAYAAQMMTLLPPTDLQGKEAIMRRALKADPDSEWSNGYLGGLLGYAGRVQEAADLLRKANAANPLALDWSAESARMSALAGRRQEATDEAAEVAKAWPNDAGARLDRLEIAVIQADWKEAFALLDGGRVQMSDALIAAARSCVTAYETPTPALRAKARSEALGIAAQPGRLQWALTCLARTGFIDDAFKVAQSYQPLDTTNGLAAGELFSPQRASLHRDVRFMQLANRIGLVRYWRATGKWPDFCAEPGLPYDCKAEAARLAIGPG